MERKIESKNIDKKEFKNYCINKINILVRKYRFFYSGVVVKTEKDLFDFVKTRKQKSRITMYYHIPSKRLFLIIYCKNSVELLYTNLSLTTAKKYNKEFDTLYKEIYEEIRWDD